MRYNSPPNWPPPPEGWVPPPGWQPDPAWGPPPHGWQLWSGTSTPTTHGKPIIRTSLLVAFVCSMILGNIFGGGAAAFTTGRAFVPFGLVGWAVGAVWRKFPQLPWWLVALPTVLLGAPITIVYLAILPSSPR